MRDGISYTRFETLLPVIIVCLCNTHYKLNPFACFHILFCWIHRYFLTTIMYNVHLSAWSYRTTLIYCCNNDRMIYFNAGQLTPTTNDKEIAKEYIRAKQLLYSTLTPPKVHIARHQIRRSLTKPPPPQSIIYAPPHHLNKTLAHIYKTNFLQYNFI